MNDRKTVGVIIPTYHPDHKLKKLLSRLYRQTRCPDRILLINTEESGLDPELEREFPQVEIVHIAKADFDHGGTRCMGAELMETDVLVFMTMDALPADRQLIEKLIAPLDTPKAACSYARQLPGREADPLERYTRHFNYGSQSFTKGAEDLQKLGIKTYFCSNVCAAYRRDIYMQLGGFPLRAIFNEDMIFAGKAVQNGYRIAYCADARVIHSHNYSGLQQLHRNFDLGVSQAEHPEIFEGIRSEGEGIRMVLGEARWLAGSGHVEMLPKLIWQSGCKYLGYRLGKNWERLPEAAVRHLTMNETYWRRQGYE